MEVIKMKIKNIFIILAFLCSLAPTLFGESEDTRPATFDFGSGDFSIGITQPTQQRTLTRRPQASIEPSESVPAQGGGKEQTGQNRIEEYLQTITTESTPGQPKKSFWSKALLPVGIIGIAAAVIATNYLSERYLGRPVVKDFARDTYQNLQPYASPIIGGLVKGISCVGRGLLSFGRSAFGALKNLKSTKLPSFGSFFSRS